MIFHRHIKHEAAVVPYVGVRVCGWYERHYQIQHQIILFNKMSEGAVQERRGLKFMRFL